MIRLIRTFVSCECARVRRFPCGEVLDDLPLLFSLLVFGAAVIVFVSKQLRFSLGTGKSAVGNCARLRVHACVKAAAESTI